MMLTLRMPWTHQTLDKQQQQQQHVGDSTDSDNEEKEDGELEEGEVEEDIDEKPPQKDDAKENNRETNSNAESINEQDSNNDNTNSSNLSAQKFRRRDYPHAHPQSQTRSNPSLGAQDKRTKHEPRRKRRHSGEDRDDRNRKVYKRGRFRAGAYADLPEEAEVDEMMGTPWPSRGPNRGQRKHPSDNPSNENSDQNHSTDPSSSSNNINADSKTDPSINGDESSSNLATTGNDPAEDDMGNPEEKQDRNSRTKISNKGNPSSNSMPIESRGRRYYEGSSNSNNNRRGNDRDRSSWQDRSGGSSGTNNPNNSRFRSDMNSNGPPLCKFFMENRCAKGNDCTFSHDYKPQKRPEVCKFYVQNKGFCQKNDACPYLHAEFPCKFFHTRSNCSQGDRCIFSHDPITNEDIRMAFERYVNDSDELNRQNRNNPNSNLHHNNTPSSMNYDAMPAPPPLLPSTHLSSMPGPLPDPSNLPMIQNFMDLFLMQNGQLPNPPSIDSKTTSVTENNANPSQTSPPVQRPSLYTDTLMAEKSDVDDSTSGKTLASTNSTSPTPSTSSLTTPNSASNDNTSTSSTTSTANTSTTATPSTTTNPSACPLPLPPQLNNSNITLPSPFGRLPTPNLVRAPNTILPPPPPGLFPLGGLQTGRVPILFPSNNGLPLPLPPNPLLDVDFITKAAIAAANAAAAKTFNAPAPQPLSPQLGRDIDERDRQPPAMMTGDIDERPSDAFNRPTPSVPNLNLFPSSTNLVAPTPAPTLPVSVNEDPMKAKAVQDLFRTTKPTAVETLPTSTSTNTTSAGPSFDFISMLEQLKQQPKQNQSADNSLEIRCSATPISVYILRPVHVAFRPYSLPDPSKSADPRIPKYQEKMAQWSERARFDYYKNSASAMNNSFSQPLRNPIPPPPSTSMSENNASRDPRLLRNTVSTSKIGIPILPTPAPPFV